VDPKSATSAQRSVTSHVTAQRPVDMVVELVDSNNRVAHTVVVLVVPVDSVDAREDRLATLAVDTDTCLVTAPKDRSATTVVRLAISPETAHPRLPPSALATSASNLATFKLNAPTKLRIQ